MSEQKLPKKRRTLIKFAIPQTTYIKGKGNTTAYVPITMPVGKDDDGTVISTDCFYCEWVNAYGNIAIQQQSNGESLTARVRMPFTKIVYDALASKVAYIYKNGIEDAEHCYVLASVPDNYAESGKMLEFNVRRKEVR